MGILMQAYIICKLSRNGYLTIANNIHGKISGALNSQGAYILHDEIQRMDSDFDNGLSLVYAPEIKACTKELIKQYG